MNQPEDLRVIKTYTALSNAFLELLKEKPITKITVKEICDKAMVRRATFYSHFEDKYQLFLFIFQESIDTITAKIQDKHCSSIESFFYELNLLLLDFVEENSYMFDLVPNGESGILSWRLLSRSTANMYQQFLDLIDQRRPLPPISSEILSKLLAGSIIQGIEWWMSHKNQKSKGEMADLLQNFINNAIRMEKTG